MTLYGSLCWHKIASSFCFRLLPGRYLVVLVFSAAHCFISLFSICRQRRILRGQHANFTFFHHQLLTMVLLQVLQSTTHWCIFKFATNRISDDCWRIRHFVCCLTSWFVSHSMDLFFNAFVWRDTKLERRKNWRQNYFGRKKIEKKI